MGGFSQTASKYTPWVAVATAAILVGMAIVPLTVTAGFASLNSGGGGQQASGGGASVDCGSIETIDPPGGLKIPYPNTKLGLEEHLNNGLRGKHYEGPDSNPISFPSGSGAYAPYTTEEERWYFNEYWPNDGIAEKKLLVISKQTKKCVVVSVQEKGPAAWVTSSQGIGAGAPPEVHHALGLEAGIAYDGNPSSNKARITVKYIKDQKNTPLGPAK